MKIIRKIWETAGRLFSQEWSRGIAIGMTAAFADQARGF